MQQNMPVFEAAARFYAGRLSTDDAAMEWLSKRSIDRTTATKFQIGVARGGLLEAMRADGIGIDLLLAVGLCRRGPGGQVTEALKGRITIPNSVLGGVKQIWGPAIEADQTPMYVLVGDRRFLFNEDRVREGADITLVEGIGDALRLEQKGVSAVATCGLVSMTDVYWRIHEARRVRVRFYQDAPGQRATDELVGMLGPTAVRE